MAPCLTEGIAGEFSVGGERQRAHVVVVAARFRDRMRGLLVPRPPNCLLVIAPCRSIHTFGMKIALDIAFFDESGTVLLVRRNVGAGRVVRCPHAYGVLERKVAEEASWFQEGEDVKVYV